MLRMNRRAFVQMITGVLAALNLRTVRATSPADLDAVTSPLITDDGVVERHLYGGTVDGRYSYIGRVPDGATGFVVGKDSRWRFD